MAIWIDSGHLNINDLVVFNGHELNTSVMWQLTMLMQFKWQVSSITIIFPAGQATYRMKHAVSSTTFQGENLQLEHAL